MESKINEYGTILIHKFKVEQTEVISRLLFTFIITNYNNVWSGYDITSSGNLHPMTFWKYAKYPIKVSLKISTYFLKKI